MKSNPPIGILTRNRAAYLDVTLRSLSATTMPCDVNVVVFDDASTDTNTLAYYRHTDRVPLQYVWPADGKWADRGFSVLPESGERQCMPIGGRVQVVMGQESRGVVTASCNAIRQLFAGTSADGVFLLQDDVVFNADWYVRMLEVVSDSSKFTSKPIGVLAGIKLNQRLKAKAGQIAIPSGITAQCLYISRRAFDTVPFLTHPPAVQKRFDDLLRRSVAGAGMWGGVIYPFVCQHIGVKSLVRPHKRWAVGNTVRIGLHASPPYAMNAEVRVWK